MYFDHILLLWERETNVLFNDTLNTFYLELYGVGHMVKDHSDSERKPTAATWSTPLYAPSHRQDSTYHGLCYTSRGALAGTRNRSMGPPYEGSIRRPIAPWANVLLLRSYISLRIYNMYIMYLYHMLLLCYWMVVLREVLLHTALICALLLPPKPRNLNVLCSINYKPSDISCTE